GQAINSNTDFAYQVFAPDGTLTKRNPVRLRLVLGAEGSGPGIIYTGPKNAGGNPANYYDIVILAETGQVKVERL
ncbi:MAG TPA: hypothetical protein VIS99_14315, partial [Terrimicrobiaceae bacterium]